MLRRRLGWPTTTTTWYYYPLSGALTLLFLLLLPQTELSAGLLLTALSALLAYRLGIGPAVLSLFMSVLLTKNSLIAIGEYLQIAVPDTAEIKHTRNFTLFISIVTALAALLRRTSQRSDEERRRHVSTLGHISDAIITTSATGAVDYLNLAAARLLQVDAKVVKGKPFDAVAKIQDRRTGAEGESLALRQVLKRKLTLHAGGDQILVRPDGSQMPVEAVAAPVLGEAGEVVGVVITLRDCTERYHAEKALHERLELQERLQLIATMMPGVLLTVQDTAANEPWFSYLSPAFEETIGVPPKLGDQEFFLREFAERIPVEDRDQVHYAFQRAALTLKPFEVEHRLLTQHRGLRWVSVSVVPFREKHGGMSWHAVLIDITERRRAAERLQASQLQLQSALQTGAMGVTEINLSTGRVKLDAMARRLWDLSEADAEVDIEVLRAKLHPDHPPLESLDSQKSKKNIQMEYHLLLENGEERWLVSRGGVYQDEVTGKMIKTGVTMDNTQGRRAELQRLHSQKLEALGVLAGGIAHDFNNLLLAISGNTRLLLDDLSAEDPHQVTVREIETATLRATDLVRRILSFCSPQELPQPIANLALRPVLQEVLGLARAVLPASVSIATHIPEQVPDIHAESSHVHQALINLLTNAADAVAATKHGHIDLTVASVVLSEADLQHIPVLAADRYVVITVADNGTGIAPAHLQRIFDPFFTSKLNGRGTGLGLAIVHGIMKSVNGAVTVQSNLGRGASFRLYFPVATAVAEVSVSKISTGRAHKSLHILYVDDEEALVFLMRRTLERMGHRVTAFHLPEQALAAFRSDVEQFDLVVSDMAMPGMSGLELAHSMLALRPQQPFIITSGYLDNNDMERARNIGVRQMIMKPDTVEALSAALLAWV